MFTSAASSSICDRHPLVNIRFSEGQLKLAINTSRTLKCQHPLISPNKPNFSLMKAVQGYQLDVEQSNKPPQSCQHHNGKTESPYPVIAR